MNYADIPFWLSLVFVFGGICALTWASDWFVDGSAALARMLGISPFVIGMVIIGFGTSAPELCVSAMSGLSGHANLSLGNAYGSCIFNITVILGIAALIAPIVCKPSVAFLAGPCLVAITGFSWWLLRDGTCTRGDAAALLGVFAVLLPFYCWFDQKTKAAPAPEFVNGRRVEPPPDPYAPEPTYGRPSPLARFGIWAPVGKVLVGLAVLVGSSHFLVWGAVDLAKYIGVSDLVIGLTIVAAGTSLPELACAIASAWRGQHEFVLGNIVGSNIFNTLAVVGIATFIAPLEPVYGHYAVFSPHVLSRDLPIMALASLTITLFGVNWRHPKKSGRVTRLEAVVWILMYFAYGCLMFLQER